MGFKMTLLPLEPPRRDWGSLISTLLCWFGGLAVGLGIIGALVAFCGAMVNALGNPGYSVDAGWYDGLVIASMLVMAVGVLPFLVGIIWKIGR